VYPNAPRINRQLHCVGIPISDDYISAEGRIQDQGELLYVWKQDNEYEKYENGGLRTSLRN
jgi:hypothetical protein